MRRVRTNKGAKRDETPPMNILQKQQILGFAMQLRNSASREQFHMFCLVAGS